LEKKEQAIRDARSEIRVAYEKANKRERECEGREELAAQRVADRDAYLRSYCGDGIWRGFNLLERRTEGAVRKAEEREANADAEVARARAEVRSNNMDHRAEIRSKNEIIWGVSILGLIASALSFKVASEMGAKSAD
jgi:hypothetical protein